MRVDRSIALFLSRCRPRNRAQDGHYPLKNRCLPVLMYHSISNQAESVSDYYKVCTSPERFRAQLQWIHNSGMRGVTLKAGLEWLNNSTPSQPDFQPVAITFDDAFEDFYTSGLPILEQLRFSATMYVPVGMINTPRKAFRGRDCMNWDEIRDCHKRGIELGSHTVNHFILYQQPWETIDRELKESRLSLQDQIQSPVDAFAYPFAFPSSDRDFVTRFREGLQKAGYTNSVTTTVGRVRGNSDRFTLPRLPANDADDERLLRSKLDGDYDWFGNVQQWVKAIKWRLRPRRETHFKGTTHAPASSS